MVRTYSLQMMRNVQVLASYALVDLGLPHMGWNLKKHKYSLCKLFSFTCDNNYVLSQTLTLSGVHRKGPVNFSAQVHGFHALW